MQHLMAHGITDKALDSKDASESRLHDVLQQRPSMLRFFLPYQKVFRAPSFSRKDRFFVIMLEQGVAPPILDSTLEYVASGGFADVYKAKIHEDFLDTDDPLRVKVRALYLSSILRRQLSI